MQRNLSVLFRRRFLSGHVTVSVSSFQYSSQQRAGCCHFWKRAAKAHNGTNDRFLQPKQQTACHLTYTLRRQLQSSSSSGSDSHRTQSQSQTQAQAGETSFAKQRTTQSETVQESTTESEKETEKNASVDSEDEKKEVDVESLTLSDFESDSDDERDDEFVDGGGRRVFYDEHGRLRLAKSETYSQPNPNPQRPWYRIDFFILEFSGFKAFVILTFVLLTSFTLDRLVFVPWKARRLLDKETKPFFGDLQFSQFGVDQPHTEDSDQLLWEKDQKLIEEMAKKREQCDST